MKQLRNFKLRLNYFVKDRTIKSIKVLLSTAIRTRSYIMLQARPCKMRIG